MLMQELGEGPYSDLFNDYFMLTWSLDEMRNYHDKLGPLDLYRSTAGEIEARDVTARRNLTPEQRRSTEPARADDHTVFMEDTVLRRRCGQPWPQPDTGAAGILCTVPGPRQFRPAAGAVPSDGR